MSEPHWLASIRTAGLRRVDAGAQEPAIEALDRNQVVRASVSLVAPLGVAAMHQNGRMVHDRFADTVVVAGYLGTPKW